MYSKAAFASDIIVSIEEFSEIVNDTKKFHVWIQSLLSYPEETERKIKEPRACQQSRKCYYVGESYPGIYLTAREYEVTCLLVKEYRYKEIAEVLGLSPHSVEFYIQHMREKLQCNNKKTLVAVLKEVEPLS